VSIISALKLKGGKLTLKAAAQRLQQSTGENKRPSLTLL